MSAPHILHVTSWYPSSDEPMFGTFVREHIRAAGEVSVGEVLHLQRLTANRALASEAAFDDGLSGIRLEIGRGPVSFARGVVAVRRPARRLESQFGCYELVHAHSVSAAPAALMLARERRIPLVLTEHWTALRAGHPTEVPRLMWPLMRACFHAADVVLPVSEALGSGIRGFAPNATIRVIPNVVDTQLFHHGGQSDHAPVVLTASNLVQHKRVDDILHAMAGMSGPDKRIRLVVAGDGPQRLTLEKLAARLQLGERVSFLGQVPKHELAYLMRQASVFVLASEFETFSVVCAEALACGVPVVATRSGGPEDFVDKTSGMIVPVGDVEALASAINESIHRSWDHASIARAAAARFSSSVVAASLGEVYRQALG